ncbi:unnamed protein product [Cuscuta campestris]|uniref:Uncharacterized protein n=1 Tax=Cuscuta campestris TaxID=132261 RepID=A0A484M0X3_9ASTE|nr:unnamed protein product [Cuscuta campestris]
MRRFRRGMRVRRRRQLGGSAWGRRGIMQVRRRWLKRWRVGGSSRGRGAAHSRASFTCTYAKQVGLCLVLRLGSVEHYYGQ